MGIKLFVFICVYLWFISLSAFAAEIVDVRTGIHPDKTRLVIDFTGDSAFQAKIDNQSLVIHMPTKSLDDAIALNTPFQSVDTTIIDNQFLKLSLPLSSAHTIKTAFVIKGDTNRLVVDIHKGEGDVIIHGPLQLTSTEKPPKKPIIMIDAGHGGRDPGAVSSSGILEKDITLSIAQILANQLNSSDRYIAKLTRNHDVFIRLHDRVALAQKADADIFISIHADSLRGTQTQGASVYTLSKEASDEQTAKLAERENAADMFDTTTENQTDIHTILFDLAMENTMTQSKDLAADVIRALRVKNIQTLKGPHRHAGFAVLKAPDIPSLLFETGFISNEAEAKQLLSTPYQKQISSAIISALDNYFEF